MTRISVELRVRCIALGKKSKGFFVAPCAQFVAYRQRFALTARALVADSAWRSLWTQRLALTLDTAPCAHFALTAPLRSLTVFIALRSLPIQRLALVFIRTH